ELDENRPLDSELESMFPAQASSLPNTAPGFDGTPQPYEEVKPPKLGDAAGKQAYDAALAEADKRMSVWHASSRYTFCPDTSDIVDPEVLAGHVVTPYDNEILALNAPDGVPDRPHWIETDLTELPPPWYPRRSDWNAILVERKFPELNPGARDYPEQ